MKRPLLLMTAMTVVLLFGCRSDADRMAEFCLQFDNIVQTASSCHEMSENLEHMLDAPQPQLKDRSLCASTTACLPCKNAVRTMLGQCGSEPDMKPILEKMRFSKALTPAPDSE